MVKKYGLPMLVTADESLKEYIQTILQQVSGESWHKLRSLSFAADSVICSASSAVNTETLLSGAALFLACGAGSGFLTLV